MTANEVGGEAAMDLFFGLACDGRAYPDFPGVCVGVVHAVAGGPSNMIDTPPAQPAFADLRAANVGHA